MLRAGDKVRLKDSLEVTKKYGGIEFLPRMARDMDGELLTIEMPLEFKKYTIKEFGYVVSEAMLEVVK